jgi:hypothetical protein
VSVSFRQIIASAIFFNFGTNVIYKYGASDLGYQKLRPNNLIMWEAIKCQREQGFEALNLGRTEHGNQGLLQFKRGWGAEERLLKYYRYDFKKEAFLGSHAKAGGSHNKIFSRAPIPLLRVFGSLLYKHAG